MAESQRRLATDDVLVGLDLASTGHQAVILNAEGRRLTRFRIPHSRGFIVTTLEMDSRAGGAILQ